MRLPNVLPCATLCVLLVATSVAQAQWYGSPDGDPRGAYTSTIEPLIPADTLRACEFNRPEAVIGTFAFDFLFLDRGHVDSKTLVTVDGVDALDASDFDFDETGVFRFTATLPSPCGVDVQFSYLGSHEFSATQSFSGANVQDSFFGIFGSQTQLTMTYEAPLDSFELNLRARQWERFVPLAGVRFVSLNESSTQLDVTNSLTFLGDARNSMVGMQFGGEWLLADVGRWRLESMLKAGVYYTDINIESVTATTAFNRNFSTTSFLGEASLMVVYEFTPRASLRAGYQGLWMEGIALLYDQYDNFDAVTGNGSVDMGSVNFQGGYLGFDFTW